MSFFAHRINAHTGTQGFVLHSAKLGLHDKGGQKGGGGTFDIVSPTFQKRGDGGTRSSHSFKGIGANLSMEHSKEKPLRCGVHPA